MSTRRRPYHPDHMHPILVAFVAHARTELKLKGLELYTFEGFRLPERGRMLHRRGASEAGASSLHCTRFEGAPRARAVDLVCGNRVGGLAVWWGSSEGLEISPELRLERAELASRFFSELGELVKADPDLEWGGEWRGPTFTAGDPAHVQLRAGVPMASASHSTPEAEADGE